MPSRFDADQGALLPQVMELLRVGGLDPLRGGDIRRPLAEGIGIAQHPTTFSEGCLVEPRPRIRTRSSPRRCAHICTCGQEANRQQPKQPPARHVLHRSDLAQRSLPILASTLEANTTTPLALGTVLTSACATDCARTGR